MEDTIRPAGELGFQVMLNEEKVLRSSDLLMRKQLGEFLESMKEKFDFIIIDAPHAKGRSDIEPWLAKKRYVAAGGPPESGSDSVSE